MCLFFEVNDKQFYKESLIITGTDNYCIPKPFIHSRWSKYVIIAKSDLEEKETMILDMQQNYDELVMQHEYQIRTNDLACGEQIKELKIHLLNAPKRRREDTVYWMTKPVIVLLKKKLHP